MKILKLLSFMLITLLVLNCSNDDDNFQPQIQPEPTTQDLLISGKWYWVSSSESTLDDCQKQSYIEFIDLDTLLIEDFRINSSDICESNGINSVTYQLIDDSIIQVTIGTDTSNLNIEFISDTRLIITQEISSGTMTTLLEK